MCVRFRVPPLLIYWFGHFLHPILSLFYHFYSLYRASLTQFFIFFSLLGSITPSRLEAAHLKASVFFNRKRNLHHILRMIKLIGSLIVKSGWQNRQQISFFSFTIESLLRFFRLLLEKFWFFFYFNWNTPSQIRSMICSPFYLL